MLTWGGTLLAVEVPDAEGATANVVHRLDRLTDYQRRATNPFVGSLVGPVANRIAGAAFTVDGARHELVADDGANHLHGGPTGFHLREWDAGTDDGDACVVLTLHRPDGHGGYPGNLDVTATYRLGADDVLALTMTATTDAPTPVNLTSHPYWNLDGGGSVAGHRLTVHADSVLAVDDEVIPTGAINPVDGTPFDLRGGAEVSDATPSLDHCYLLDGSPVAATLVGRGGRRMDLATNQPGLQVYLGDPSGGSAPTHVCLEAQAPPDAVNQPHLGDVVLRSGHTYEWVTRHAFGAQP